MALFAAILAVIGAPSAQARTLGITAPPAGALSSGPSGCGTDVVAQVADAPSTRYIIPAAGGRITAWQVNTTGATAGDHITLVVLRNTTLGSYSVIGTDARTLPSPLPANHVATFTLSSPITVQEGDTLGLYTGGSGTFSCYWFGGSTPKADILTALSEPSPPPSAGQTLNPVIGNSPGGFTLNVAATLSVTVDPGVTSTSPAKGSVGHQALLTSTVTNHGPATDAITFRDTVPSGLTVNAASAGNGLCAVSGQVVACVISDLTPGSSVPVNVVVTPRKRGSYVNTVTVSVPPEDIDTVSTNNSATSRLKVVKFAPTVCTVPNLKRTPSGVAKRLLKQLGCKVKVKRRKGNAAAKGAVLKTKPRAGSYALGRKVTLIVRK